MDSICSKMYLCTRVLRSIMHGIGLQLMSDRMMSESLPATQPQCPKTIPLRNDLHESEVLRARFSGEVCVWSPVRVAVGSPCCVIGVRWWDSCPVQVRNLAVPLSLIHI